MLPALSFRPSFGPAGFEEGNPHSCVQLFWITDLFWAVTYLHANGQVSGSHVWIGKFGVEVTADFPVDTAGHRWAA